MARKTAKKARGRAASTKTSRGALRRADINQAAAQSHFAEADRQAKAGNLRASNIEADRGAHLMGAKTDG